MWLCVVLQLCGGCRIPWQTPVGVVKSGRKESLSKALTIVSNSSINCPLMLQNPVKENLRVPAELAQGLRIRPSLIWSTFSVVCVVLARWVVSWGACGGSRGKSQSSSPLGCVVVRCWDRGGQSVGRSVGHPADPSQSSPLPPSSFSGFTLWWCCFCWFHSCLFVGDHQFHLCAVWVFLEITSWLVSPRPHVNIQSVSPDCFGFF